MIRLADDLAFPVDFAGQTTLLVGKRGSGKTSTATVMASSSTARACPSWCWIRPTSGGD